MARDDRAHPLTGVELVPYRPEWAEEYEAIAAELRRALGSRALRIDHIGSTSVPGLAAKDVVDVQVTVDSLEGISVPGYEAMPAVDHVPAGSSGEAHDWEKLFLLRLEPRRVHVHVRRAGGANGRYALLFRDYLRADAEARSRWEETKRRLASEHLDRQAYAEAKDPLTDELMAAAEHWAVDTGWVPPAH